MSFETLTKNVTNIRGKKGAQWLKQLPDTIKILSEHWSLSHIQPVNNMSWSYVALAMQNNSRPAALKIHWDPSTFNNERHALQAFHGAGSVTLFDESETHNALLLQQAIPGHSLKTSDDIEVTIAIYANVVDAIASQLCPDQSHYEHVRKWCKAIDRLSPGVIKHDILQSAKEIRDYLLNSAGYEYLCHGDLHLDNIIQHQANWMAIDPKGIIGEKAFEAAAFDLLSEQELKSDHQIQDKLAKKITLLTNTLQLDQQRLIAWIFLRIVISIQWFIEDNGDPNPMLQLLEYIYPLLDLTHQ